MNRISKLFIIGIILCFNEVALPGRGPSQPEAAKFEPIDATDLVSLYTGNFTYNLPLLEIPGPEGGWPVNIFYHAGIGPNTEASWVGLGWDLNAGSINRFVNGYPDDYFGGNIRSHYYAPTQKGAGVYFGISYGPVGIDITFDCYTGKTGVNASYDVLQGSLDFLSIGKQSIGIGFNTKLHIGTSGVGISQGLGLSVGTYGEGGYTPTGYVGVNATMMGGNTSVSNNFQFSGFSLTSSSSGVSIGVGKVGFGFQSQSKLDSKGNFTSSEMGLTLPLGYLWGQPVSISFGSYEWEWSLNEVDNEVAIGSLHQVAYTNWYQLNEIWGTNTDNIINKAVIYTDGLSYASTQQGDVKTFTKPKIDRNLVFNTDQTVGALIFTAEDNYQVGVQGLAGSFQPYFEKSAYYHDVDDEDGSGQYVPEVNHNSMGTNNNHNVGEHVRFRFDGDNGGNFVSLSYGGEHFFTISDNYGSKKIKPAFDMGNGKLLGFEITTEDGKIYEFYQPIFSYYSQSYKEQTTSPYLTSETIMSTPYATSWLITGVKGPDYIDRGEPGYTADDWGYWVKFRYGTSSTLVPWRTPHTGTSGSIDPVHKNSVIKSEGLRENVYLESIETATHIAIFHKLNDRKDDKNPAVDSPRFGAYKWNGNGTVTITFPFDVAKLGSLNLSNVTLRTHYKKYISSFQINGGAHNRIELTNHENVKTINLNDFLPDLINDNKFVITVDNLKNGLVPGPGDFYIGGDIDAINLELGPIAGDALPQSSRRLDKITVHKKTLINASYKTDYAESNYLPETTLEGVKFDNNHYDLQIGAPNTEPGFGKLRLKGVSKIGDGEAAGLIPPTEFIYGNNPIWGENNWDIWGGYTSKGTQYYHMNSMEKSVADADAGAWCLSQITFPTGAVTSIEYESDYIDKIGGDTENKLSLFTPWFYQGAGYADDDAHRDIDPVKKQPEGYPVNFFYITDTYSDMYGTYTMPAFSDFLAIYQNYAEAYNKPMPAAISYYHDLSYTPEVGKQNSIQITNVLSTEKKVIFNELLTFNVSDYNRHYNYFATDPYTGQYQSLLKLGKLFAISPNFMFGGGHRIKSISVSDGNIIKKTAYRYGKGYLTVLPSLAYTSPDYLVRTGDFTTVKGSSTKELRDQTALVNYNYNILGPSPLVGYDKVEVIETDGNNNVLNGKSVHEFNTSEDFPFSPPELTQGHLKIVDHSNKQGLPKSTVIMGLKKGTTGQSENDYYTLQARTFTYKFGSELQTDNKKVFSGYDISTGHNIETNSSQPLGLTQRLYSSQYHSNEMRIIDYQKESVFISSTMLTNYTYDENNSNTLFIRYLTENIGFIAHTGSVGISQTYTSTGEKIVNEAFPAFWFYPDMKAKNMLTQNAETKSYRLPLTHDFWSEKTAGTHNNYLISAEVTTWKDWSDPITLNEDIWRINDTYNWIGQPSSFLEFIQWDDPNPGDIVREGNWQRTSNINAYDRYSHPTEEIGLDGEYTSSIYGYGEALPIAIISNARRTKTEIGSDASYLDFESGRNTNNSSDNDYWTFYQSGENQIVSNQAHTGTHACKIIGGTPTYGPTRDFLPSDFEGQKRKYKFSFWVKTEADFPGNGGSLIIQSKENSENNTVFPAIECAYKTVPISNTNGKWVYYEGIIDLGKVRTLGNIPDNQLLRMRCFPVVNCSKYMLVDDLRFQPLDASMSTYTYNGLGKVTSITDNNNVSTFYIYDQYGRLQSSKDQDNYLIKQYNYNFKRGM